MSSERQVGTCEQGNSPLLTRGNNNNFKCISTNLHILRCSLYSCKGDPVFEMLVFSEG